MAVSPTAGPALPATDSATETPTPPLPAGCPPDCAGATLYRVQWPGRDLAGADLDGAYLRLADLRGANLAGANLQRAQLDGANLTGANLSGASLRGAHLRPALLDGPSCPGQAPVEVAADGAETCLARLGEADLGNADLAGADLRAADLREASLRYADLAGADLREARLQGADLQGVDLGDADLRAADLSGADLVGADLWGADLRQATIDEEQLAQALRRRGGGPSGESLACTDYRPPGNYGPTWNIEVAPDASVWVSAYRGLARFDLRTGGWTTYTEEDGLPSEQVRAVTIEPDGSVWVTFQQGGGAAHYDGERWTRYSTEDGLVSNLVAEVSMAPDGSVWFATEEGATHWDRETDTWTDYTEADGLQSNEVWRVLFTPDGRTWFAHRHALTSWLPAQAEDGADEWQVHDDFRFLAAMEALVSEDGRLWLGQVFWDPEEEDWQDTVYRELEVLDLAVDGQGGLWIGRPDGAIYLPDPESSPPEVWQHYGKPEGLADDRILVIALEGQAGGPENVVWFGLVPGVARCVVGEPQGPEATPTVLP
jgi:uncharacterized protein YjbI with pentapeptide repeats